jgi:hypothetical protein
MATSPLPSNHLKKLLLMAGMARLLTIVLLVCAVVRASLGAAGSAVSANGRYAVELSRTPEEKLLVSVFQVAKEQKTHLWSRTIEWRYVMPGPGIDETKALV